MILLLMAALLTQSPARRIMQTGTVIGQLLQADGSHAAGVIVAVTPVPDSKPIVLTGALLSLSRTDQSGSYRLENIRPGRYFIQAGPLDSLSFYPGTSSLDKATIVNVVVG